MASRCLTESLVKENPGALLGAVMGALAGEGRDKLTLIASPPVAAFGMWVDQLIAESTGKDGMGIVPIVNEPQTAAENYGDDRLFVYLRVDDDPNDASDEAASALRDEGHPMIVINLEDAHDLVESSSGGSSQRRLPRPFSASSRSTSRTCRLRKSRRSKSSMRLKAQASFQRRTLRGRLKTFCDKREQVITWQSWPTFDRRRQRSARLPTFGAT